MRGDEAVGHVDAHNELRSGLLREAARFGTTIDIGGPYSVNDPGHVQEHEKTRAALAQLAKIAGITVTLPPVRKLGDHDHAPGDHDLLDQALAAISKADAWNDASGGTVNDVTAWQGRPGRWRVHTWATWTGQESTLVVRRNPRKFVVGLWGGGGAGKWHFEAYPQPTGGAGGSFVDEFALPMGNVSIFVGRGGGAKDQIMYGGWAPSGSRVGTLLAGYGRNGGGAASHEIQSPGDPPQVGSPTPLGDGRESGQEFPSISATKYGFGENTSRGGYGKTGGDPQRAGNGYDGAVLVAYQIGG